MHGFSGVSNHLAIVMLYIALEPSCQNFLINVMYVTVTIVRDASNVQFF